LIQRWQNTNSRNLVAQTRIDAPDISDAVLHLFDCWINPVLFDAQLEFAVRNWAHGDASLQAEYQSTDATRILAIRAMFERYGYPTDEADIRANMIYLTQIGYITSSTLEPLADRIRRIPTWLRVFTGRPDRPGALEAFLARHQTALDV
jgi:hypothetical protein